MGSAASLPPHSGALGPEEEVAPLAGPSLPPRPCGPGHVHPHVTYTDQLPQHQADGRRVTSDAPLARHSHHDSFPFLLHRLLWAVLAVQALVGTGERAETSSPAWQGTSCVAAHGAEESQHKREHSGKVTGNPTPSPPHQSQARVPRHLSTPACRTRSSLQPHAQMGKLRPKSHSQFVVHPRLLCLTHGAGFPASRRVMVDSAPCLLPLCSVAPSAVEGRHSSWIRVNAERFSPGPGRQPSPDPAISCPWGSRKMLTFSWET